jgi:hypothetical protein
MPSTNGSRPMIGSVFLVGFYLPAPRRRGIIRAALHLDEGESVSIAKAIRGCEQAAVAWIAVEDEDGNVYRYVFKRTAPGATPIHVNADLNQQQPVALTLADDGKPALRQDEPGLPKVCIVRVPLPAHPGASAASGFRTNCEHERG